MMWQRCWALLGGDVAAWWALLADVIGRWRRVFMGFVGHCHWVLTWRVHGCCWAGLLGVRWRVRERHCWAPAESMSSPRIGPKVGVHQGAWWWRWRLHVTVVVVGDGGGSGKGWGTSQHVTFVTFQPWLLDLATRRRLLIINGNYY